MNELRTTPIFIVSGFLGAGKTTWIQKIIAACKDTHRIMIIENDFGQVNFDSALLAQVGVEVTELSSGCICCSLAGDFKKSLKKALQEVDVDLVIIEPSGVGMLSDIKEACLSEDVASVAHLAKAMTIVDAVRSPLYVKNFGEFFEDQVAAADMIVLSHCEDSSNQMEETKRIIGAINEKAPIIDTPWEEISLKEMLFEEKASSHSCACHGHDEHHCCGGHEHHHCSEGHGHHCFEGDHHGHEAGDTFTALPITIEKPMYRDFYEKVMETIKREGEKGTYGHIIRVKGVVPIRANEGELFPHGKACHETSSKSSASQYMEIQYVPGQVSFKEASFAANTITIIGHNLAENALRRLWTC